MSQGLDIEKFQKKINELTREKLCLLVSWQQQSGEHALVIIPGQQSSKLWVPSN